MADEHAQTSEREIEEDVVNVGFIAWLGGVATILIAVSVILLTGVYYLTLEQREARLQEEADARVAGQPATWHDPHNNGTYCEICDLR